MRKATAALRRLGTGGTGASGAAGASVTGRTLWFQSISNATSGQCLGHQQDTSGTCPAGTAASFTFNYQVVTPGVLTRLWAELNNTRAPTAGQSWIVTVRVNGVASTLTCTIIGPAVACEGASVVAVVAGDQVQVQVTAVGSPQTTGFKTYVTFS